jgi:CheY-like chemotaxis protein/HPt (histidine-containing phosphotransfer) domain-containing protein
VTLRVKLDPTADTRSGTVHRIRFSVEDTGVGISKEAQKNLFNPFAQADSSTSRKFGGTGLGLAISQRLIEAMGGKIHIDSTEGHGSIFFFTLIVENGSAEAVDGRAARSDFAGTPEKSLNILGVEDNEINQKLLKEFVQRLGHKITLCGLGEKALEMVAAESFDMILMDVNLPGLSGMGTTKAIRAMKDRQKAAIPIIALTGKSQESEIRMCYTVNMNGHMVKPVDPKRLKGMIEKVIANKLDNPVELPEESVSTGIAVRSMTPVAAPVEVKPAAPKIEQPKEEPVKQEGIKQEGIKQEGIKQPGLVLPPMPDAMVGLLLEGEEEPEVKSGHAKEAFDEAALSSLKGAMPPDDLKQMVDGLFDKINEIVTVMTSHTSAENIASQAHDLKGMAGNFGLREMSDAATHIEKFAADHDINDMREWCARLPAMTQRSHEAIQSWLRE